KQPSANNYGGHQFGHWAGQLGDGRAISLGELVTPSGQHWELQLKGAGPTPYSRGADGRAVLRSSLREFLCSEAMHHLGVPTTRALSLVGTGEEVVRDMFYDGHPRPEPGAVVCRVAPSFLRFGSFELPASRRDDALLEQLARTCIGRD
ncbi:protein adenylyltransferase SelO family protein, partial [Xanthomonas citri pv. citri]